MKREKVMEKDGWLIEGLRRMLTFLGFTEEGIELFIALLFVREELLEESMYG